MGTPFYVVTIRGVVVDGLPTPRLISEGGGEAWCKEWVNADGSVSKQWRASDTSYDPPGTTYVQVRVIRNPESLQEERDLYSMLNDL